MQSVARRRVGEAIRDARQRRGWSQEHLGSLAGIRQSVVSAVESGREGSIETLERLCVVLGGTLRLDLRLPFAGEGRPQRDAAHARCLGAVRRLLTAAGYVCVSEQLVTDGGWSGWIDLLAYHPATRRLIVVEVKTELLDAGALERQVERYARGCLQAARSQGWAVKEIAVVAIALATDASDDFLASNRDVMAGAFPVRGRAAMACLLDHRAIEGRMLLLLDPRRRGRRVLMRARVDGRRTPAPYRDLWDFAMAIRGTPSSAGPMRRHPPATRGTPSSAGPMK